MFDLTGKVFGRLTVLGFAGKRRDGSGKSHRLWHCKCECGTENTNTTDVLRSGGSRSCGCLNDELRLERATRHGDAGGLSKPLASEYGIWNAMIGRCYRPKTKHFSYYGGRGITVCDRWCFGDGNKTAYECFLSDVGRRPDGHTIDRIDGNRGYEPGNVRWATRAEQQRNLRSNRLVTLHGQTITVTDACKILNLNGSTVRNRMWNGQTAEQALGITTETRV